MPVRPKSIVQFELVYWAIIALGLVNTALSWSSMMATVSVQRLIAQLGSASVYVTVFVGLAIQLLLWYFVARRGSVVAKWIFVILSAIGIFTSATAVFQGDVGLTVVTVIALALLVLQVVAIVLLFRPDTRPWFGEDQPAV